MIQNTNIYLENYYDFHSSNYYQILALSNIPNGPLKNFIKHISIKNVSSKIQFNNRNYCTYVIDTKILESSNNQHQSNPHQSNPHQSNHLTICTLENLSSIYDFLKNNNYTVNNELSNILIKNDKKILFSFN